MSEETKVRTASNEPFIANELGGLNLPTMSRGLKEIYTTGGFPLVLIFVAVIIVFNVEDPIASTILASLLFISSVVLFMFLSVVTYRQWREESKTLLANRRMEIDLYQELWTTNRKTQDKFLMNILNHLRQLTTLSDSTPEGRKKEIDTLATALGPIVHEFIKARNNTVPPKLSSIEPKTKGVPDIIGGNNHNSS